MLKTFDKQNILPTLALLLKIKCNVPSLKAPFLQTYLFEATLITQEMRL